ncbi:MULTISPECIES: CobW family GTP-binding protein [unclassified Schlesneria]|uniref:CobW family GTP-binding protein n=1 Tax=unclassified Schlesneria TaxID=2762017 RepID=UPI002EFAA81B
MFMTDRKRIPTNLITGFLGVGKTSAIRHLISQKPAGERWAVLVNEFGEVGIDGALIESAGSDNVAVTEIAGGCFCCSSDSPIEFSLMELIRQTNPDRVVIEPTGLGHPAKVLDTLRGPWFRGIVDLRATICLADPADYANPAVTNVNVFQDQLHMADVVVVNKLDRTSPDRLREFLTFLNGLFPPKAQVLTTTGGRIDRSLLDTDISPERTALFPDAHPARPEPDVTTTSASETVRVGDRPLISMLLPGHPVRKESRQSDRAACGWIFSPLDTFRQISLFELFSGSLDVHRLKGVFNVGSEWILYNRVGGELTYESIPYRRDSRLEVILDQPDFDWNEFEVLLLQCLKTR